MSSTPLEELERLKAEYDKEFSENPMSFDAYECWEELRQALVKHADWLLTQAREAAENKRDAERYRYLRDVAGGEHYPGGPYATRNCGDEVLDGPELDAAIDSARRKEG